MKLKIMDRILLSLLMLAIIVVTIALLFITFNVIKIETVQAAVNLVYGNTLNLVILGVIGFIALVIALRLIFPRGDKTNAGSTALIKVTEIGAVEITFSALDSMVQKHCRNNARIRECISRVYAAKDAVTISLRLSLMPDTNLPELTTELQKSLKQYIEELSGITVQNIRVLVESTSINPKSRVD